MNPHYIIIGAGSTGSVIANRLSQNPQNKVLLLEAGYTPAFYSKIPGMYGLLHKTAMNWGFYTEPQKHVNGRRIFIPRGKSLGGSSSTNAMAYVRGNRKDYDHWAERGNRGWSYESLLPYFKKSENHQGVKSDYHNISGELHVDFSQNYSPSTQNFLEACKECGIPFNADYNGESQEGASFLQYTIKNKKRKSTFEAFLKPVSFRSNLKIQTGVQVKRIIIKDGKAVGVEIFTGKSTTETLFCTKEIILCAGAIQSPQILKISGIGNKEELNKLGIELVYDLPGVGENLKDHIWTGTSDYSTIKGLNSIIKKPVFLKELIRYWFNKPSLMDNSLIEGNAFFRSSDCEIRPDLQFHFSPFYMGLDYTANLYDPFTLPTENAYTTISVLLHPKSTGNIMLQSADSRVQAIIQPNFLSEQSDLEKLIIGLRKAMEVMDSTAFESVRKEKMNWPSRNATDDTLAHHIRKTLETLYHPVGTCRMGLGADAVVNDKLQVYGVENLRVADASIMPDIISGNTNAACIMIGEKASDLILND